MSGADVAHVERHDYRTMVRESTALDIRDIAATFTAIVRTRAVPLCYIVMDIAEPACKNSRNAGRRS
jgi:hypothetical protein